MLGDPIPLHSAVVVQLYQIWARIQVVQESCRKDRKSGSQVRRFKRKFTRFQARPCPNYAGISSDNHASRGEVPRNRGGKSKEVRGGNPERRMEIGSCVGVRDYRVITYL